ncbi:hypothetical protein EMIHUDRAFT_95642 [Emiliania huxleyi CCMP1516]|uniref:Uncharacterized protein n=2 Tax=Emiliania huxleyi TaxID=2903 RepID=A0A0D3JHS2_EMIH1|nr:hypothetical protein EMIHUDRAFT_95642 [Emiliania huxleyi CCMP1516]EOD23057.1 hypothetical protein EMIHUDRAFT_95642 [Emiliania huxleyi CCMP1516]|eukprot:XP_005775486.1 hypothetical protein EMIHUDRAFT_95642 [Emiliania huxleyi CCMP1516]
MLARVLVARGCRQRPLSSLHRFVSTFASVNGERTDPRALTVSAWDVSFQRGDGVFEVVRVLPGGKPRALSLHLDRLERSADAIQLPLPPRETLSDWCTAAAADGGIGSVRLMATKGAAEWDAPPTVFVMWQPLPSWPPSFSLQPAVAPWHAAGADGWDAVKWLAYAPNLQSTRRAVAAGTLDALLLLAMISASSQRGRSQSPGGAKGAAEPKGAQADDGLESLFVLDGPNFAVGWADESGALHFPDWRQLGLLQSTTQALAMRASETVLGRPAAEGVYQLSDVLHASEVFVMSTTRGCIPVHAIGGREWQIPPGGVAAQLEAAIEEVAAAE